MNIKYIIVKNEMPASAEDAKYLGRAIPNGVRNRAQMTALALGREHFAEATFNAVVDAALAITQELCAEGRDVDWGPVRFLAKIHGSLPCEDSAFADGTASLTLDADATNQTRETLAALVPVKATAAEVAALIQVSNVMDVATERFGAVVGTTPFQILGNGITLDADGEYAKAFNKKTGALAGTAQVVSVSKGQRATCKFTPQLASGDYALEIATRGLAGETTPRIFRKPVTAVAVPAPTVPVIDKVVDVMHLDSPTDHVGSDQTGIQLVGENLGIAGYQLTMEYRTSAEAAWQAFSGYEVAQATANAISLTSQATAQQLGASDYRFTVTNSLGTATRTVAISA